MLMTRLVIETFAQLRLAERPSRRPSSALRCGSGCVATEQEPCEMAEDAITVVRGHRAKPRTKSWQTGSFSGFLQCYLDAYEEVPRSFLRMGQRIPGDGLERFGSRSSSAGLRFACLWDVLLRTWASTLHVCLCDDCSSGHIPFGSSLYDDLVADRQEVASARTWMLSGFTSSCGASSSNLSLHVGMEAVVSFGFTGFCSHVAPLGDAWTLPEGPNFSFGYLLRFQFSFHQDPGPQDS